MLTLPLLEKVKGIEGWLSENEADLLISTTLKSCINLPAPQYILEIGSYKGKSTVLLGSTVKDYFPDARVYAIDPHEGTLGAADQHLHTGEPTLEMFMKNIESTGLADRVELIRDYSFQVHWDRPIAMLFIDGLHDYLNVSRDFYHFIDYLSVGGYAAFHDYAYYYPGVMSFVDELLMSGKYEKVALEDSLIVVKKL